MARQIRLTKATEDAVNEVRADLCELYGVSDLSEQFSVEPSIQQKMETAITESSSFLKAITTYSVDEPMGAKIMMEFNGFIGKRTNTDLNHDRISIDPHDLDESDYLVNESEYDNHIKWQTLNSWAKFPDFYQRWNAGRIHQIALNRITWGFWGQYSAPETSNAGYAAPTDTKHTMGQDFHMGWLAYLIHWMGPDRVMGLNADGSVDKIRIGPGAGDNGYENMDQAVIDLVHEKLPSVYQSHPDMKAFVGNNLYHKEVMRLSGGVKDDMIQKKALDMYLQSFQFGNKPVIDVPFFPEGCILITPPKNLAHINQEGSHQRSIEQNKHRKRLEDFNFMNEDAVMTDVDMACMFHPDCIEISDGNGGWKSAYKNKWEVEVPEGMEG